MKKTSDTAKRRPAERPGRPGGKRDANRKRRLEDLRTAGLRLFLERGVDQVTIDDIAKEAGTAKGNFYRYYEDKSDLVRSILEPLAKRVDDAMDVGQTRLEQAHDDASVALAYQSLAMGMLPIFVSLRDELKFYLQECRAPESGARAPVRAFANRVRERAIQLTVFAVDAGLLEIREPKVSSLAVVGAVEALSFAVLTDALDVPIERVAETLIGLVLNGIRAS